MVSRILLAGFAAALNTPFAVAQTPAATVIPNTISAEATDILRVAPDVARLTFSVVTKDLVAETATDENEKLTKDLLAAIAKLKLNGLKVTSQALKIAKVESDGNNGAPVAIPGGGGPMLKSDYRTVRTVTVTVKDADVEQLQEGVGKIQKEAAKLGVAGDSTQSIYNGFGNERQNVVRVSYGLQAGWDDRSKEVLSKLTKRALERAALLADGAGLKVAGVVSIIEPNESTLSANSTNFIYGTTEPTDELSDGELVLKVRVRVTVRVLEK